jgi:Rrf2 family protein
MLRLSKQVDYGILLLSYCGNGTAEKAHSARDLADETGLPLPMVSKILKTLAREGILESQRGTRGGYALAKPTSEISVASVVQAFDGPVSLVDCAPGGSIDKCRLRGRCRTGSPLRKLAATFREMLENTTVEELIADLDEEAGQAEQVEAEAGASAEPSEAGGNGTGCELCTD